MWKEAKKVYVSFDQQIEIRPVSPKQTNKMVSNQIRKVGEKKKIVYLKIIYTFPLNQ